MPQIKVLKPFAFAHRGVELEQFEPSDEPQDVAQEVVDHDGLVEEGYIELVGAETTAPAKPARKKAAE